MDCKRRNLGVNIYPEKKQTTGKNIDRKSSVVSNYPKCNGLQSEVDEW